jgi:hypothetical protein
MHFQGKEVISRSTHVAHRSLITVTVITIISRHFELDLTDITVFGLSLTESSVTPITLTIIILLLINYALNYWGDYASFKHWNIDDKPGAEGTSDYPLDTRYEGTLRKVKAFHEAAESLLDAKDDKCKRAISILDDLKDKVLGHAEEMDKNLKILIKGHSQLDLVAKIQLYIWYGVVPLVLTFLAICLNYNHQFINLILNLIPQALKLSRTSALEGFFGIWINI